MQSGHDDPGRELERRAARVGDDPVVQDQAPDPMYPAILNQAAAIVSAQAGCTYLEAIWRLDRCWAAQEGFGLTQIAYMVIDGEIRFD
jgi:hypothetical protein